MGPQIVSHPINAARFVAECAVELGFECGIECAFELRTRLITQRDEMAPENVRFGRGVLDCQTLGDIPQ